MNGKLYTLLPVFFMALLFSCKTAKKTYEKGNYDEAVELAARKLQKKPNDGETLDILKNAYRFAVEDHENRIKNNSNSTNELRPEWNYNEYLGLQRLYEAIHSSPAAFDAVHPTDYSSYVATYQEQAGNMHYDRGLTLMGNNDRNSYKDAYYEFSKALNLKPGDLSARQKMDEAYNGAVVNVIILPLVQPGYRYSSYNYNYSNFDYSIMNYLTTNNSDLFIRYYSPADARGHNIRTDMVAEMRFSNLDIDHYHDQLNAREVSKQVVVKETVLKKDSVIKEYATVKARITTTRRILQCNGLLQVTVKDNANRWIWSDTYRGDYNWSAEFSNYNGDERALSEEDKKLTEQREQFPPSNDEIIRVIMNEIQNKAACGIKDYFNRF